jgi:CRP-like cAMP-binding protein
VVCGEPSELGAPFLIGEHELLMDAERWVASYSAVVPSVIVRIPKRLMAHILEHIQGVREQMHGLVMRRQSRFYWVSLATSGSPPSRVAAALVSRLALEDRDFGRDRRIAVRQKDIGRLTTMSRSAVAAGLIELAEARAIRWGAEPGSRFAGEVLVPDVDRLKDHAFLDVRNREIAPLLARRDDE